ncbi:alpha/beta hydrolase [Shewanella sp. KCT]|uniref:alpha/beta hydrolase n=1 Tax=Shewanella sp. KCT TaxID=2569535 RepID=UPI00118291D4|nr:alpha/beta hydrolase [Shewanella sp. KCT]TVP13252.1 alpha/beta hydrolase [Shewanella sp. KCT]
MLKLRFLAGPTAYKQIAEQGLKPELFTQVLAASGGPKWLGIAALDKYLFGTFFKARQTPLYTLGASSGAWRLACLAQQDPLAAYERLEREYIGQRYETKPTASEVSHKVAGIVSGILGAQQGADIVGNPVIKSHFIACRGRHLNRLSHRAALGAGLATTAVTNLLSRRTLGWHFERYLFGSGGVASPFNELRDLPGRHLALTGENIAQVLLATGSIPWVLAPVERIEGAPAGHYYDGGITDYHFDLPLAHAPGLTLYPHFYSKILPGWFDKSLPWRRAKHNYDNALILAPSESYLNQLPYGKLPDRNDFSRLNTEERIRYWRQAVQMSEVLADDLDKVLKSGDIMRHINTF